MKKYHKIKNIYVRDTITKKLIEGNYESETVRYLSDIEWYFTEKIDGTNIRVIWDGHRVTFGGRTDNAEIPNPLLKRLEELFGGSDNETIFEQKFGDTPVTLYGEGYGAKIQSGGNYRQDVDFILFDVMIDGKFLSRAKLLDVSIYFNIDVVPIVFAGKLEEGVDYIKRLPKSTIAQNKDYEMEGIVARPIVDLYDARGNRIIVKIKCCDFKN